MESQGQILNAVKNVGVSVLTIGIILFGIGYFGHKFSVLTAIGVGTVMGAVFIFLMGVFFVATQEMLEKRYKGIKVDPIKRKKGAPL